MLTVKLTETEMLALDQVVRLKHFKSRSAAVRGALDLLFDACKLKPEARKAIVKERKKARARRSRLASR